MSSTIPEDGANGPSLSQRFDEAFKRFQAIEDEEQEYLDDLTHDLRILAHEVEKLSLYSVNEEFDDIHTFDLKYMLVPGLLGLTLFQCRNMDERKRCLENGIVASHVFLSRTRRYKLLDDVDTSEEAEKDQGKKRDIKIARHKELKKLTEKVNYLFSRKKDLCGDEYNWGKAGALDEEAERDLMLALIRRTAITILNNVPLAEEEIPLLEMRSGIREGTIAAPTPAKNTRKPWCVKIKDPTELRQMYLDQVFQPDINMPTIPLSVAVDQEIEEALELRARQDAPKPELTEEEQEYKDRNWDDWKEDNPKGSGNTMANIG